MDNHHLVAAVGIVKVGHNPCAVVNTDDPIGPAERLLASLRGVGGDIVIAQYVIGTALRRWPRAAAEAPDDDTNRDGRCLNHR